MAKRPEYANLIRTYDFHGVTFYDVWPLTKKSQVLLQVTSDLMEKVRKVADEKPGGQSNVMDVDTVASIEARGFIFGTALAVQYGFDAAYIRKAGKLPGAVIQEHAEIEYGSRDFEIQADRVRKGEKLILIDDVLATGGSLLATASLIKKAGGIVVGIVTLLEILGLGGREKLTEAGYKYASVLKIGKSIK